MAKQGEQAQVPKRPIRQTRGWNRLSEASLVNEHLNCSAMYPSRYVFCSGVKCPQSLDHILFRHAVLQVVKHQAEVASIFQEEIFGQVGLLRQSRCSVTSQIPFPI